MCGNCFNNGRLFAYFLMLRLLRKPDMLTIELPQFQILSKDLRMSVMNLRNFITVATLSAAAIGLGGCGSMPSGDSGNAAPGQTAADDTVKYKSPSLSATLKEGLFGDPYKAVDTTVPIAKEGQKY